MRKCKYCDKPAKVNYHGIKRLHKGYLRTCGSKECLSRQYSDVSVCKKKTYSFKNIKGVCEHCSKEFIKENCHQKWCKVCVPDASARAIIQRYNLNKQEYLDLINKVSGICPICKKGKAEYVDHCHKTGKVRGIICPRCNTALSLVEDTEIMDRATKYLRGEL